MWLTNQMLRAYIWQILTFLTLEWRSNISEPVGAFTGMAGKGVDEQVLVGDVDEVGELYSRAQCNILFVDKLL